MNQLPTKLLLMALLSLGFVSTQAQSLDTALCSDPANAANISIPQAECESLVDFHNAIGGGTVWNTANMPAARRWASGNPISNWYGLSFTANRVSGIDFNEMHLTETGAAIAGTLTDSLGLLSELRVLKLSVYNGQIDAVSGPIPMGWNSLSNLVELELSVLQLSGPLPDWLGNNINLQILNLRGNELSGPIPASWAALTQLETLELGQNQLSGSIPSWLGNFSNLESLGLNNNNLSGNIPASLGMLNQLTAMHIGVNNLSGAVPTEFGNLTNLRFLRIDENNLSGTLPPSLANLTQLGAFNLSLNNFSGSIPSWFGSLGDLNFLSLRGNNFTGVIPSDLESLTQITYLDLSFNQLTGQVPSGLGNLSTLEQLYLQNNFLQGNVQAIFQNLIDNHSLSTYNFSQNPASVTSSHAVPTISLPFKISLLVMIFWIVDRRRARRGEQRNH